MGTVTESRMFENTAWIHHYGETCVYCGQPADTKDHVPPQIYAESGDCYPACMECNRTLGTNPNVNLAERKKFLLKKYKTKYHKILNFPAWDEYEKEELDPDMRDFIEQSEKLRTTIKIRLECLK